MSLLTRPDLPILSVVITTYNRTDFLTAAIASVLNQTFTQFELIVVDDCSSDATEEVVKLFTDRRIRYLRHDTNQGVSVARNTGIQAARANYVCFLDDDDAYLPTFLACTESYTVAHPEVGFMWTGVNRVFLKKQKTLTKIWHATKLGGEIKQDMAMLFLTEFSASCGLTVSKACFEKAGMYRAGMNLSEDLELVFRMVATGCDYHAIPHALIQVNIHERSSLSRTSSVPVHIRNTIGLIDDNAALMGAWPLVWLHYQTVLVADYYRIANFAKARELAAQVLKESLFYFPVWERICRFEMKRAARLFSDHEN